MVPLIHLVLSRHLFVSPLFVCLFQISTGAREEGVCSGGKMGGASMWSVTWLLTLFVIPLAGAELHVCFLSLLCWPSPLKAWLNHTLVSAILCASPTHWRQDFYFLKNWSDLWLLNSAFFKFNFTNARILLLYPYVVNITLWVGLTETDESSSFWQTWCTYRKTEN